MKKKEKKWEELKKDEEEHFEVSSAIFRDWIAGESVKQSREELKAVLESRRRVNRVIMPDILLLRLQYGASGGEQIVDAIMAFDDDSISKALADLVEQGLK